MSLAVVLTAEAEADLDEAAQWYEARLPGLGAEFIGEVRAAITFVASNPNTYAQIDADLRRAPLKRFPYGVFYRVRDSGVCVLAVLHDSRDPTIWQSRA